MFKILGCLSIICLLVGCMNYAIRKWNSGPQLSPKEAKIFDECQDDFVKRHPRPVNGFSHSEEQKYLLNMLYYIDGCENSRK